MFFVLTPFNGQVYNGTGRQALLSKGQPLGKRWILAERNFKCRETFG